MLQWSRDVSVADSLNGISKAGQLAGFNGAATFPSRIVRKTPHRILRGMIRFNGAATFPSRIVTAEATELATAQALQWSRDVSVADSLPSLSTCAQYLRLLQWSRDVSVADSQAVAGAAGAAGLLQ